MSKSESNENNFNKEIKELDQISKKYESNKVQGLVYSSLGHILKGKYKVEDFLEFINAAQEKLPFPVDSVLADTLWLLGVETEENKETRKELVNITKFLLAQNSIKPDLLKERLEGDVLEEVGITKLYNKKLIRINTKYFLTQQKFNLLREESEGYAKLVTELNQSSKISTETVDKVVNNILSLIGYFDLDPNRVFDICLDSYENNLDNEVFLKILLQFKRSNLAPLVGFKFQFYQIDAIPTPKSLFLLCAKLIKHNLVTWEEIYVYLKPDDADAVIEFNERMKEANSSTSTISLVNFDKEKEKVENKDKDKSEKANAAASALADKERKAALASQKFDEQNKKKESLNQKFGLVAAMLEVDDWASASSLLEKLRRIDPCSSDTITFALCAKLTQIIDPYYEKISPKAILLQSQNIKRDSTSIPTDILLTFIFPMLKFLHFHIYKDIYLLCKLCRLFKEVAKSPQAVEFKEIIEKTVACTFLVALTFFPMNPGMSNEIWELVKIFPYTSRYTMYNRWKAAFSSFPELIRAKINSTGDAKKVFRRLAKENVKQLGRVIGKLSHSSCIVITDYIVEQIQQFDSLIVPIVDALKYATPLTMDILSYVLIEGLASTNRDKLKPDGTNVASWFAATCAFSGLMYKKYPLVELSGLLQYIVNQLKDGQSLDLLLLKELIAKMGGIEILEDVSEAQLEAQAGGETLRLEVNPMASNRNLRKPTLKLRDALVNSKLAIPLLILIAQQKSTIIFRNDSSHLKLIGDLFDKCQETLLQYTEFLSTHISNDVYAKLIPNVAELIGKYHFEPETAFFVTRQVLPFLYDDAKLEGNIKPKNSEKEDEMETDSNSNGNSNGNSESLDDYTSKSLITSAKHMFPDSKIWKVISPQLYVTFWSLSLYDIYVPKERYEEEIKKLTALIAAEEKDASLKKKEKEKDPTKISNASKLEKIKQELEKQEENHQIILKRLNAEKNQWLELCPPNLRNDIMYQIIQYLIFPRCIYTTSDAIYCAKFAYLLHKIKTPYFSTIQYVDKVMKDMVSTLSSCTENEACRLGRFVNETLVQLWKWRDESVYIKECDSPGFSKSFQNQNEKRATYKEYVSFLTRTQIGLSKTFAEFIESKDYMLIKNTLLLLTKIIKVFPFMAKASAYLEKRVSKIREDEREDLKVLATRYHAMLENNKKNLYSEEEFKLQVAPGSMNENNNNTEMKSEKDSNSKESTSSSKDSVSKDSSAKTTSTRSQSSKEDPKIKIESQTQNIKSSTESLKTASNSKDESPKTREDSKSKDKDQSAEKKSQSSVSEKKKERSPSVDDDDRASKRRKAGEKENSSSNTKSNSSERSSSIENESKDKDKLSEKSERGSSRSSDAKPTTVKRRSTSPVKKEKEKETSANIREKEKEKEKLEKEKEAKKSSTSRDKDTKEVPKDKDNSGSNVSSSRASTKEAEQRENKRRRVAEENEVRDKDQRTEKSDRQESRDKREKEKQETSEREIIKDIKQEKESPRRETKDIKQELREIKQERPDSRDTREKEREREKQKQNERYDREKEKIEKEKSDKLEKEKEREKLEKEKQEKEKLEKEKQEKEKLEKEKNDKLEKEKLEKEKQQEAEKREREKKEKDKDKEVVKAKSRVIKLDRSGSSKDSDVSKESREQRFGPSIPTTNTTGSSTTSSTVNAGSNNSKTNDSKSSDSKSSDSKSTDSKSIDSKSIDSKTPIGKSGSSKTNNRSRK